MTDIAQDVDKVRQYDDEFRAKQSEIELEMLDDIAKELTNETTESDGRMGYSLYAAQAVACGKLTPEELNDKINQYNEIKKKIRKETLTPEDDAELRKQAIKIRNEIVEKNLLLVIKVARFCNRGKSVNAEEFSDAVQDGNLGLIKTIDYYDPNKGFQFSTYAWAWIKRSIIRGRQNNTSLHIPSNRQSDIGRARTLQSVNGYTQGELSSKLQEDYGWSEKKTHDVIDAMAKQSVVSLNVPVKNGDKTDGHGQTTELGDLTPDTVNAFNSTEKRLMTDQVVQVVNKLNPNVADLIKRRFGIGEYEGNRQTDEEIAAEYMRPRQTVTRTINKGLKLLRENPEYARALAEIASYLDAD